MTRCGKLYTKELLPNLKVIISIFCNWLHFMAILEGEGGRPMAGVIYIMSIYCGHYIMPQAYQSISIIIANMDY